MGLEYSREEKLANLIIKKHNLSHPFDIEQVVSHYAVLLYKKIPITGVDGVCVNIKTPGKKPKIIINNNLPATRKLFTLAHELGHLIIPWHTGTIVDDVFNSAYKDFMYRQIESEANHFAAQLLMPAEYVLNFFTNNSNLADLHKEVVNNLGVSAQSAAIRIIQLLPPEIVYFAVEDDVIIDGGKTVHTNIALPANGSIFNKSFINYYGSLSQFKNKTTTYYWYNLKTEIPEVKNDRRDWRQVLDNILQDINPPEGAENLKRSINGKVGFANGSVKNRNDYSFSTVFTACLNRMKNFENQDFVKHSDYETFLKLRSKAFVDGL